MIPTEFNAGEFFRALTDKNRLCREHGFRFRVVSDLEGFADTISEPESYTPLVCVSDTSAGAYSVDNAPAMRTVKTVFLYMPIDIQQDWITQRQEAFRIMKEIFRQFLSVLILQKTALDHAGAYIDPEIRFTEIDRHFHTGGACAYFQISIDKTTDLILRQEEWTQDPTAKEP